MQIGRLVKFNAVVSLGCALLIAGFVLYATRHGIAISPDSVGYIAASESILHSEGFLDISGQETAVWPPLFPAVLMVFTSLGVPPLAVTPVFNASLVGVTVFLMSSWLLQIVTDPGSVIGLMFLVFAFPVVYVATFLWSEPLFLLFVTATLIALASYVRGNSHALILAAIFSGFAAMTRYAGIVVILTGFILIWLYAPRQHRLKRLFYFGVAALMPISIWLIRNAVTVGSATGERSASVYTLGDNLHYAFDVLVEWMIPETIVEAIPVLAKTTSLLAILAVFAAFIMMLFLRRGLRDAFLVQLLIPWMLFTFLYLVFVIVTASTVSFDSIDTRLLAPVYMSFVACAFLLPKSLSSRRWSNRLWVRGLLIGVIIFLALKPIRSVATLATNAPSASLGLNSRAWGTSQTLSQLRQLAGTYTIYSNRPDAIHFFLARPALWLPRRPNNAGEKIRFGAAFSDEVRGQLPPVYIAWFNSDPNFRMNPDALASSVDLLLLDSFEDGQIFEVQPVN